MTEKNPPKLYAEIVNGKCPSCTAYTTLVGISNDFYRCMNCGCDLQQHVNGKIRYLPAITRPENGTPFVREWLRDGEKI
jgi:transposase-like protein